MPVAIPAIVALAAAGYQAYQSNKNSKEAKKLAGQQRPDYEIPQTEYDNLALAGSRAGTGLDATTRQNYLNQNNAGFSGAVGSILRGGGDPNAIGSLYNSYEGGLNNLAVTDDAAKMRNIQALMTQRERMSDMTDKQWQVNKYAPWANNQALAAQLRQTANQQQDSAVKTGLSAVGGLAGGASQASNINSIGALGGGLGGGASQAGAAGPGAGAPAPGIGINQPDSYQYTHLIGGGMGAGMGGDYSNVYNPGTNTFSSGIDWSRINPQSRGSIYKVINSGYNGTY